jgi:hypothetical protein
MKYKTADVVRILRDRYQSYGAESLTKFIVQYFPDGEIKAEAAQMQSQLNLLRSRRNLYGLNEYEHVQYNRLGDHANHLITMVQRLYPDYIYLSRIPMRVANISPIQVPSRRKIRMTKKTGATLENMVEAGYKSSELLKHTLDFLVKNRKVVAPVISLLVLWLLVSKYILDTPNEQQVASYERKATVGRPNSPISVELNTSWVVTLSSYQELDRAIMDKMQYPSHDIKIVREGDDGAFHCLLFKDFKLECDQVVSNPYFIKAWPNIRTNRLSCGALVESEDEEYWICR